LSAKIKTVDEPGFTDHVHYVESVETSTYEPRVQPNRRRQVPQDLGRGVTPKKLEVVAFTLILSMGSILLFNGWEQPPETPSNGPGFPRRRTLSCFRSSCWVY
jgi:hypothetical protein